MKIAFSIMGLCLIAINLVGQTLYIKSFGNELDPPLLFLHGGPGYNCANFEATTAQLLADEGFFVIVYDRRGEGRSKDKNAKFSFAETFDDIHSIYQKFSLEKSGLIGHSFGGVIATLFAEKYPEKINSIVLVGAPISLQATFKTIIVRSKEIYSAKNDSLNLNYISILEKMDSSTLQYSSYCFSHAMQNGFYRPKNPSEEAKKIYGTYKTDTLLTKYASQMTYPGPQGFWKNENYTTLDLVTHLKKLKELKINIYGIYGKEDGLYSAKQINELEQIIGENNVKYLDDCSHNVFVDQQNQFFEALNQWSK